MSVEILAWNIRDGFSDEVSARHIVAATTEGRRGRPTVDLAVFSEAYREGEEHLLDLVTEEYDKRGYTFRKHLYEDADGREDRHGFVSIVSERITHGHDLAVVRFGGRNAVRHTVENPTNGRAFDLYGLHLNDRSEALRQAAVADLAKDRAERRLEAVAAGDLNSAQREHTAGAKPAVARTLNKLVDLKILRPTEPKTANDKMSVGRVASLGMRLDQMLSGETIKSLERDGFVDADVDHEPTMPSKKPFAQLDHVMLTSGLVVSRFEVRDHDSVTDHRAITATIDHAL